MLTRLTRRQFLRTGVAAGAGLVVPWGGIGGGGSSRAFAAIPCDTLDPTTIPKYVMPLVIPPAMPRTGTVIQRGRGKVDYYEIAVRQFQQQILPTGLPMTTVWSYGSVNHPGTFNYPAFTIEAKSQRPVRVKWINDLKNSSGAFLPHLLPVDPTLHWANPPGGCGGTGQAPDLREHAGSLCGAGADRDPSARGAQRPGKRWLCRGLVSAGGRRTSPQALLR